MTAGNSERLGGNNSGKARRNVVIRVSNLLLVALVLGGVSVSALLLRGSPQQSAVISISPNITYQTMTGWEATIGGDWRDKPALAPIWNDRALDMGVEMGLNRVRLPVWSGAENTTDWFQRYLDGTITQMQYNTHRGEIINDNTSPNVLNSSAFNWTEVDWVIDNQVLPLRDRLAARGETLWINANYHGNAANYPLHQNNPTEYAEFVLAAYEHFQSKYGWIPDSWTIQNEPNNEDWNATQIGNVLVAAGDKLAASSFASNIHFIAPSEIRISDAVTSFDTIWAINGASKYLKTLDYHSYGASNAARNDVRARIIDNSLFSGMGEHAGADYVELHTDIVEGRISTWQQFNWTGYIATDNGGKYIVVDEASPTTPPIVGSRAKFLRQYFKYVRIGAKRIEATSSDAGFEPLAFINRDGKYVLVVKAQRGGTFSIRDLPPGTYGIKYTTTSQYDIDAADQTLDSGQMLIANIPDRGVLTVYTKAQTGGQTGQAVIDRCKLKQGTDGTFTLLVYGANIESGASVTVGQVSPRKVKFQGDVSPGVYTRLKLKGSFCNGLPGSIIVTNPGAPPSAPFSCNSSCQ